MLQKTNFGVDAQGFMNNMDFAVEENKKKNFGLER